MEQNTNRFLWVVGVLVIGALLLGGGSVLAKENFLPKISQAFEKMLEGEDETADRYIVVKIRDEDKTKNESAIYIFLTKNADGTLTIHHAKEVEGDGPLLTKNSTGELHIPDEVNGLDITKIGNEAFAEAKFTKLTLPKNLKQIGDFAFVSSPLTGELSLPENIEEIGIGAFESAKFSGNLILPSKLKEIRNFSFSKSKFTGELSLPENMGSIGYSAFFSSTFTGELNLPQNVEQIGDGAFQNSIFTGELNLPQNVEYIGGGAFKYSRFTGTFESRSNLKEIGPWAFQSSNFTGDFKGFESLEKIAAGAFQFSTFTGEFVTPSSLKNIYPWAFENSKFTGTLDLFNISTIVYGAFNNSLFTQVNNPRNLHTTTGFPEEDSISDTAIHLSTGEYYSN